LWQLVPAAVSQSGGVVLMNHEDNMRPCLRMVHIRSDSYMEILLKYAERVCPQTPDLLFQEGFTSEINKIIKKDKKV
jgi:hypothetical protein